MSATIEQRHFKRHYLEGRKNVNPSGIVPVGPELDFLAAHGRVKQYQQKICNNFNLGNTYLIDMLEAGAHGQMIA